jgi:hypothetical protein
MVLIEAMKKNFIREDCSDLYEITDDLEKVFAYVENTESKIHTVKELKDG